MRGLLSRKRWAPLVFGMVLAIPSAVDADWLLTPTVGATLGRDTHGREHVVLGTAIGWADYDPPIGWEVDFSFAPDFFEGDDNAFVFEGDSHVGTLMFNGVLGDLAFTRDATGWRPYLTAGLGIIQARAVTPDFAEGRLFDSWVHEVGINAGGGAVLFLGERIGVRADLRYVTSLQDGGESWTKGTSDFDVAPGKFDFFRGTVGVTFRFPQ